MAFDQNITYRVNVDDTDFQAKLSQLRASLDMTMGGSAFAGMGAGMGMGMGGFTGMMPPMAAMGAMMAPMQGGYTGGMMSGLADFGAQIRPITYTPPAIAMQPHFGMVALQQTTGQAFAGAMGLPGLGVQSAMNFIRHPFSPQPNVVPPNMSVGEYTALSTRAFATRVGDVASTAGLVTAGTAASFAAGGIGAAAAEVMGMGALGVLGVSSLATLPVSAIMASAGEMMAQNRAVQTQLEAGSFRFITGGQDVDPLTGRGFSRAARARVADFVQSQELRDLRFGMPEMREILETGMQLDMFSGTRDVEDFKRKFSGLVETMKTITSTLHTSISEGMEVMRGFRDIGVTDPSQMTRLTLGAETMGRMAGRTGMEMLALGQAGAEIFRGTGVSMQLGMETNMQNVALVRQMLNMGTINRETVGQAGGENALAQQLTASALAATQSAVGRGAMLGMFDPSTGGLNLDFRGGTFGVLGRAAARTPMDILNFQARQEEIVSKMSPMQLQMFGMQVDLMQAKTVTDAFMGGRQGTPEYQQALENQFINMEKRRGVPIAAIRANLGLLHTDPTQLREQQEGAMASMAQQAAMEDIRNNFNPIKAITNWWGRTVAQPIQRLFTGISTQVGIDVERLGQTMMGASLITPIGADRASIERGRAMIQSRGGMDEATRGTNMGVLDASGNLIQRWVIPGGGQSGEDLASQFVKSGLSGQQVIGPTGQVMDTLTYQGMTAMRFKTVDDVKKFNAATGQQMEILTKSASGAGGAIVAIPVKQLDEARKQQDASMPSATDIEKAAGTKLTDEQKVALERIRDMEKESGKKAGFQDIGRALFGEKLGDAADVGFQRALVTRIAKEKGFEEAVEQERASARGIAGARIGGVSAGSREGMEELRAAEQVLRAAGGDKITTAFNMMTPAQQLVAAKMIATTGDNRLLMRSQLEEAGISRDEAEKLDVQTRNILKDSQRADVTKHLDRIDLDNAVTEDGRNKGIFGSIADKITGALGISGGAAGAASPEQGKTMVEMANQTLETMKLIAELQKYVKDNMPRR